MIRQSSSLENLEDLAHVSESRRERTKRTTGMCPGMPSAPLQYLETTSLKIISDPCGIQTYDLV